MPKAAYPSRNGCRSPLRRTIQPAKHRVGVRSSEQRLLLRCSVGDRAGEAAPSSIPRATAADALRLVSYTDATLPQRSVHPSRSGGEVALHQCGAPSPASARRSLLSAAATARLEMETVSSWSSTTSMDARTEAARPDVGYVAPLSHERPLLPLGSGVAPQKMPCKRLPNASSMRAAFDRLNARLRRIREGNESASCSRDAGAPPPPLWCSEKALHTKGIAQDNTGWNSKQSGCSPGAAAASASTAPTRRPVIVKRGKRNVGRVRPSRAPSALITSAQLHDDDIDVLAEKDEEADRCRWAESL
ncbi:hypothetical protein ABB37_08653 [Leptomonas pyrrhocoris]|uniref:Uncharacterized protein n=1 Tax=Leptomonas pyrrhocoris TaxID=157538 RepID=A0A0N0VDE8_LEPPY|nr:hypothetical protein ABB37_08653 [Leptomonas pyrrhocoris]KPA75374.1 hypothetical protein ABB37_08653 [Leptomonas pyrrhocoris]|eukprot:XP_015653813.1 hypothetical protein ABB37_08653 [Leptomonas pyrrhocoris]